MKWSQSKQKLRSKLLPSGLLASLLILAFVAIVAQIGATATTNLAYAQTVSQVNGGGDYRTFNCPGGQQVPRGTGVDLINIVLSFSGSGTSGTMTGTWTITGFFAIFGSDPQFFQRVKTGTITDGKVSGNHFVLTGVENADALCGGSVPSDIKISGVCQPDQRTATRIQFEAKNGEVGTFYGKVTCSTTR
jgi:hypothetical protein